MELICKRFVASENLKQQRELFRDCFPETNGDSVQSNEHYYWKFHSFPSNTDKSWEYVSYLGTDMVGYYAALPYRYKIGNEKVTIGMVCDVMTSSNYRGKGIFTKMGTYSTDRLAEFVPFAMGYPIRKEVIPGHLKVGWKIAFEMPLYMKFLKMDSFLRSRGLGFITPIANSFLSCYNFNFVFRKKNRYSCGLYSNVDKIEGYESLMKEWAESMPNALIKDLEFAKWRYNAPNRTYRFLEIKEGDKTVAFVSFRKIVKEGVPSYAILDFVCLPDNKDCICVVNKELVKLAKADNVEAIMTMMSRTSAKQYKLLVNRFLKTPFVFNLIVKDLTNKFKYNTLLEEKNWHLMWVDSDDL